jgi:hypothetical protein
MALERGYEASGVEGARRKGPRVFWVPNGKETTVVLLDDDPVKIVRHRYYLRGDRDANDMRLTCFGMNPSQHPKPCPRECLACNAAIKHNEIKRQELFYLTLIDERKFEKNGREYQDQKLFLEMSDDQVDLFRDRKKSKGKLVGARFRVYRGKDKTSDRLGSSWEWLETVELARHFWHSPAILKIMEAERKKDPTKCPPNRDEHYKRIVFDLVKPFDYEKLIGVYNVDEAEQFIAVVVSPSGAKTAASGGSGDDVPPPPPPASMPNYAVPPGATPQYPGATAPAAAPQQGAPSGAPAYAAPPPPVSDPATATAPAGGGNGGVPPWEGPPAPGMPGHAPHHAQAPSPQGYQAPPAPAPTAAPPPQGYVPPPQAQQHGFAPPPMSTPPAGRPAQGPTQTPAPGAPPYDFSAGWGAQPPGMGQTPAAPVAPAKAGARAEDV